LIHHFVRATASSTRSKPLTVIGFLSDLPDSPNFEITANSLSQTPNEITKLLYISTIAAKPFLHNAQTQKLAIFSLSLYEINSTLDITKKKDNTKLVPPEYHEFLPLFSEVIVNQLPLHRLYNHKIPLKEGFTLRFSSIYSLAKNELEALKAWSEENLA
jgi:hypothetical protein